MDAIFWGSRIANALARTSWKGVLSTMLSSVKKQVPENLRQKGFVSIRG
jgi:hypothetical protein